MTPKRRAILAFIAFGIAKDGYAPTLAELACKFGISRPVMHGHVDRLVKDGHLVRTARIARGLALPRARRDKSRVAAERLTELADDLLAIGMLSRRVEVLAIRRLLVGGKAGT